MQIRKMILDDKSGVLDMMRAFYSSDAVFTNGSEEIFNNDIEACVRENPYLEGFVFENDNGELAGYAMIAKSFSTEFGKKCIWIEDIYIKEEFRSKGFAKEFFEMLFASYKNVIFRLEVEEENENAVALYKKCGFEILPYMEMIKNNI